MAKVFLKSVNGTIADDITLVTTAEVFGTTGGNENVYIANLANLSAAAEVVMDANIEGFTLAGVASDYLFSASGNVVTIYKVGTSDVAIATIVVQDDTNGTAVTFLPTSGTSTNTTLALVTNPDGSFYVKMDGQELTTSAATIAPVFASAAVNGTSLVLTYTEATTLDATNAPATSAFTVSGNNTVTAVVVDASAKTVTLTLGTAVVNGDVVTVGYTDPTTGNDTAALQDAAGNDAITITAQAVTNNTVLSGIVAATDLIAMDSSSNTAIDASLLTAVTGTADELTAVATAIGAGTITAGTWNSAPSGGALTVGQANTIDAHNGEGGITATITDTAETLATLTGPHAYAVTVTGESATLEQLKLIDLATSGFVNASSVTSTSGSVADALLELVTNNGTGGDKISHNAAVSVFITDATGTLASYDLAAVGGATTGTVTVANSQTIAGNPWDLIAALGSIDTQVNMAPDTVATVGLADGFGVFNLEELTSVYGAVGGTVIGTATDQIIVPLWTDATVVVAATESMDSFDFFLDEINVNITVTNFTLNTDKIRLLLPFHGGEFTPVTGDLTPTFNMVYFLGEQAAGGADSAAAAASAMSAAATWADSTERTYFVISDDNSSAIYKWVDAGSDEMVSTELTLMGTVGSALTTADLILF